MRVIVTGGAGFIGSAVVRHFVTQRNDDVLTFDKLTYAGTIESLKAVRANERHSFVQGDVCDRALLGEVISRFQPDWILHLAAESHVDRSISDAGAFLTTNVMGTFSVLEEARSYFEKLPESRRGDFRLLHVSTDEVYGALAETGQFVETTRYDPSSPYAASKAASDHLARAWMRTYGLPVIVSNCSNNYGPYQFPEKLIPLAILQAFDQKPIPIYGKGENVRDWLYVEDHVRALELILERGRVGETYNIGGRNERRNIDVARRICAVLDEVRPQNAPHDRLLSFVTDRPGHDFRYAIDAGKLEGELGWKAEHDFDTGIDATVRWYLDNEWWWQPLRERAQLRRFAQAGG
jgi:dTDP-glucose 4,6-dehydratase